MEGNQNFTHSAFLVGDIIIQENNYLQDEREKSNPYNMTHLKQYLWYSPCQPKHSPKHHLLLHKIPIHFMCVLPLKNGQCNLSHFITTSILFIHSFSNQWLLPKQNTDIICIMYQVLLCHGVPLILKIKGSTVLIFHSDMKYLPSSWSYT